MPGGSQSFSCSSMEEIRCHCGLLAPVKMSWSNANPGKRYRACQRYGGHGSCRFFQWLDFDVTERVAQLIRGLLKRLDKQQNQIQKLEIDIEKKEVEVQHLTLKNTRHEFALNNQRGRSMFFLWGFSVGLVLPFIWKRIWECVVAGDGVLQLN
nr:GRF zinc finger protein [Ipomoea batatas]